MVLALLGRGDFLQSVLDGTIVMLSLYVVPEYVEIIISVVLMKGCASRTKLISSERPAKLDFPPRWLTLVQNLLFLLDRGSVKETPEDSETTGSGLLTLMKC
jgi:hypothetical protein